MTILQIFPQFRPEDKHTSQTLTLDGVRFRLDTYTNKADDSWYLNIYDSEDNPLVLGIAIASGLDLLFPYRYLDVPPGILFVNTLTGATFDPVESSFADEEVALYYQTAT